MLSTKLKEAAGNSADATLYVDDVFSTYLYTGNGSTQTITNGIDLAGKGGMVWVKERSSTDFHNVVDTVRGQNRFLQTNNNYLSTDYPTLNTIYNFSSTGFSVSALNFTGFNDPSTTYASWTFCKAAKFFDVQTITHTNGTANNIDLSVLGTVGMVIAKITASGTVTVGDWDVWQRSLTAGNNLVLNTTAAQSTTNAWLSVSGTTATLSASAPTGTYVIYAYAHDTSSTGVIQCGSFTSDGSANATVNLGWEPQYLIAKPVANTGNTFINNWLIYDSMRGWPTSGVEAMLEANLSDAEIATGAKIYPTATGFNYLSGIASQTFIYMAIRRPNKPPTTGTQVYNGSTTTLINVGFASDMQIGREYKNVTQSYSLTTVVDRLRGGGKFLITASTDAEGTTAVNDYTVQYGSNQVNLNYGNGAPLVAWNFKRAPGFFDMVCYTGTGVATTQAHNLTVVPELMIVKERSAINNWWVYDAIDGNTKYSVLNSAAIPSTSSTAWNNTTPTASVFSIGTATNVNASAQTFVAYLFATLAGISKVGSYTGNGTGQAIACGFGSGGARFVLIKRTDSTGGWYTYDSARGLTSGSSPYLLLNSTAAETTGNNGVYASSGGFTLGATAITTTNIATATYIFLAVA